MALDPVILFGIASGLPLVALGVWVATLRPRQPANVAFALFATVFGLRAVSSRFTSSSEGQAQTLFALVEGALLFASAATVVHLTLVFPRPPSGAARTSTILGGVVAAALSLALIPFVVTVRGSGGDPPAILFVAAGFAAMMPALAIPLLALPGRMREARDDAERGRLAWLAGGLAVYPGGLTAAGWHDLTHARGDLLAVPVWNASAVALGFVLPLAALAWLALAARGVARRTARDLALLTLAVPLVFWLVLLAAPSAPVTSIARVATVVILGLAILRGQLLDVDVRVRWTISRSTIAASFVAVFFIASETAQQFFGETLGSTYVGIAAAGALVFAMAPLQRVAERLAESAVPRAAPGAVGPLREKEEMYREAVRLALRDRTLTRAEERHLFRLARGLDLAPDRAHEILVEVEAEA